MFKWKNKRIYSLSH